MGLRWERGGGGKMRTFRVAASCVGNATPPNLSERLPGSCDPPFLPLVKDT